MKIRIKPYWRREDGCIGSILQGVASQQEQQTMEHKIQDELARQGGFQRQAWSVVDPSIAGSSADVATKEIQSGADKALTGYKDVNAVPDTFDTSRGILQETPGYGNAWASLMAATRAPEQGYSELALQQMIKNLRAAQSLGVISQLARSSAQALPLEESQAQHSWDWLSALGSDISSVGGSGAGGAGAAMLLM